MNNVLPVQNYNQVLKLNIEMDQGGAYAEAVHWFIGSWRQGFYWFSVAVFRKSVKSGFYNEKEKVNPGCNSCGFRSSILSNFWHYCLGDKLD